MVFFTEVDVPKPPGVYTLCKHPPPLGAFRDAGQGALRRWQCEQVIASRVKKQKHILAVDDLRDKILGRVPPRPAKELVLTLPPLPALKEFKPSASLPLLHTAPAEVARPEALPFFHDGALAALDQLPEAGSCRNLDPQQSACSSPCLAIQNAAEPASPPHPGRKLLLRPAGVQNTIKTQLHSSSSWAKLPAPTKMPPKRPPKVEFEPPVPKALPDNPSKPTVPMRDMLPFEGYCNVTAEAWAPEQGERERLAEKKMQLRLRRSIVVT